MAARVVTLVPWRPGEAYRDGNWRAAKPNLMALGYELFTGDSVGKWARAAACNAAATAAGDWDIALIADADTLLEPEAVYRAVERVKVTEAAARPHDRRWMLALYASKLVRARGVEALRPKDLRDSAPGGGALVLHRRAWDLVGGYDERFVGWGYEDTAMNISLAVHAGWELSEGNSYHLWHPVANTMSATAQANRELLNRHRAAHAKVIDRRSKVAGFDLNTVL